MTFHSGGRQAAETTGRVPVVVLLDIRRAVPLGSGFIVWQEVWRNDTDGIPETVRAIVDGVEPVVVATMAITYVLVQGGAMIAESYLRRRFEEGREEGKVEGEESALSLWKKRQGSEA